MTSELELELFRQSNTAQIKHSYFLLGTAVAAIGYSFSNFDNHEIELSNLPLLFSLISWGLSFVYGCRYREYAMPNIFANSQLISIVPTIKNSQLAEAAKEGIISGMSKNDEEIQKCAKW